MSQKKELRLGGGLIITLSTIALFWYYLAHHLTLLHQLLRTSPLTIMTLLVLFSLWFAALGLILVAVLRVCNLEIPLRENLALNAYSTFLNYFLPGQGGPVLRGLYLKGKYELPFRRYLFASLIYYVFYAGVSMLLLIGGIQAWWQTLLGVCAVSTLAYLGARFYARRHHLSRRGLNFSIENMAFMAFATCLQAVLQVAIFWVELSTVSPGLRIGQVMSYTGAADFALFVNITPGAVGIRETFLIFSQKLHHITNAAIVGANVLDRSIYILFLALIFVVLLVARGRSVFSFRLNGKGKPEDLMAPAPAKAAQLTKTY